MHEAPEAAAPGGPDRASGQEGRGARAAERARGRRRRSRTLVAAGAAAVLLVGGGVTYAVVDREEAPASGRAPTGGQAGRPRPHRSTTTACPSPPAPVRPPRRAARRAPHPAPSGTGGAPPPVEDDPGARRGLRSDRRPGPEPRRGDRTDGDPADDGAGGAADGAPPPAGGGAAQEPACHPIGGGKYTCTVWRTADSHWDDGSRAGVLNAGTNYFYCQSDLGRRETHGEWTNVWWAKTDDDSGNTGVWFSDVYIRGGDNDAPVPGLPLC